jgi:S1-C subfamily serine protease
VVVALVAAVLGASMVWAFQRGGGSGHSSAIPQSQNVPGNANAASINEHYVAGKVSPSVVDITSYLGYSGQVFEGTGMILSSSGLVLTNNHVVNQSTKLKVTLVSTGKSYAAEIVGTDAADDVALLKLNGTSGLKPITAGNSSQVTIGTPVVAIGNAGGRGGPPTVTSGSITALHRTINASDAGSNSSETLRDMMQTNAPIAEGDSGGPLANAAGQVIGMDTAANTQNLGGYGTAQGFAIPVNRALEIARQMAAGKGSASIHIGQPAFMGIAIASTPRNGASGANSPQQQLQQLQQLANSSFNGGIDSSRGCLAGSVGNPVPSSIAPVSSGTLIAGVFCNAPARTAGLRGGDVIVSVDGHTVTSPLSLTTLMSRYRPGNTVSVTWVDTSGGSHTGSMTLAAGPAK